MDSFVIWWYSWGVLLLLFFNVLLIAWLVYDSQARRVRALGWLLAAAAAAMLALPSLLLKFASVDVQLGMAGQIQSFFYLGLIGSVASLIISIAGLLAVGRSHLPPPPPPPPPPHPPPPPPSDPGHVHAWLVDRTHSRTYQLIAGDTRLGRGIQNTIVLDDPAISREHLLIRQEGDQFTLFDRGSHIGTLVNSQSIVGPCLLQHGDTITVGDTELEFATASQVSYVA